MSTAIQNLLHTALGDGARSTKFDCLVMFTSPSLFVGGELAALVKTAQFPGKSHEVIDVKFKGRNIPIKGQVKYDNTWTCTFYLTEDHKLKKGFEDWIESLDQKHNVKEVSSAIHDAQENNKINGYTTTMTIYQLDFEGRKQKVAYHMRYAYPKSVSMVEVDYSAVGTVLEFTVEFSYAYYDTENLVGEQGNFVDELKNKALNAAKGFVARLKTQLTTFASEQGTKLLKSLPKGIQDAASFKLGGSSSGFGLPSISSSSTKNQPVLVKVSALNTYVSDN